MSQTASLLASYVLAILAGACIGLALANRILTLLRDGAVKLLALGFAFLVPVGGLLAVAVFASDPARSVVIAGALAGVMAGEFLRIILRRVHAGTRPVDTAPHHVDLARPFTTTDIVTHRYEIRVPEWTGTSVRIAHISDLHVNPHIPEDYFREVFNLAERADPDFVFVTGDFISDPAALPALEKILRPIGRSGIFAVLGNHDCWSDEAGVRRVVSAAGLRLLPSESVSAGGNILISGTDFPWGDGRFEIPRADPGTLHLVLSHTPDNIYRLARTTADCVFSGHLHAGQFRIPHLGSFVVPSLYGRRFDHGHFIVRETHLFVASGVGAAEPPFRIWCQPDIFVIDIHGAVSVPSRP